MAVYSANYSVVWYVLSFPTFGVRCCSQRVSCHPWRFLPYPSDPWLINVSCKINLEKSGSNVKKEKMV